MMKCLLAESHGSSKDYDKILKIGEKPIPTKIKSDELLLRVLSCSLAPGDVRTLSGWTSLVQHPKSGFPYTPGGDVVGIVEKLGDSSNTNKFKVGDCVISRFNDTPEGGIS